MEQIMNLVRQYAKEKKLEISQEEVEEEVQRLRMEWLIHNKYSAMQGKNIEFLNPFSKENKLAELYEMALDNKLMERAIEDIIYFQKIEVSREEKEQEADAISLNQNLSKKVIYEFLGENLDLLERDIKHRKALEWLKNKN